MKMLICEDENKTRDILCNAFKWSDHGIDRVFAAADGAAALDIARAHTPEIILTDVRMPKINGFELVSLVLERRPETCVIVVSAYSEPNYLKNAIKLGAIDYLFKPVLPDELLATVCGAVKRVNDGISRARLLQLAANQAPLMRESFLKRLLDGSYQSAADIVCHGQQLMMPIGERQQYVLVRVAPSPESRKPFQELLDEIISKISSFEFHAELSQACAPSSMEVVLLLAFPAAQAAVRARISTELNMLKSSLSKLFRLGELACSFEITNVLTQLPACYDRLVKGYCDTSLDDGANRAGLGQHAFLVSKIKQLISEKYAEPSLTVSMIAERMRYTPAYICMVFRRQTGMTPGDYISQVRHVHAKRLLQDVTLKICDVAALSGYESENYFSKVFKKHESVSPSEYRKDRCNDER